MFKRRLSSQGSLKDASIRPLWAVIGLGNVGGDYENSRHNFGFLAAERLSEKTGCAEWKKRWNYFYSFSAEKGIIIAKPRTMMNLSGIAAVKILEDFDIPAERMIVIYDDLDIPFGKIRIRPKGSFGGHKGMLSIISVLKNDGFPRIRLGIGREKKPRNTIDYVLGGFSGKESEQIDDILDKACEAALSIIENGPQAAMNEFN